MSLYYLDTSAALKLLVDEPHSGALTEFYLEHLDDDWVASDLLRIETIRSVRRGCPEQMAEATALLESISFLPIDEEIVLGAMAEPELLRLLRILHDYHAVPPLSEESRG